MLCRFTLQFVEESFVRPVFLSGGEVLFSVLLKVFMGAL